MAFKPNINQQYVLAIAFKVNLSMCSAVCVRFISTSLRSLKSN